MNFDYIDGKVYYNNIQYKLSKFGNEISIVFQNYKTNRNILFTGDFGKEKNWAFIEENQDGIIDLHSYYDVIKIPHHGTSSYYHSFINRMTSDSKLLIPNGYINRPWNVSPKYHTDAINKKSETIRACNKTCPKPQKSSCPKCICICPNLYYDI